MKKKLIVFACLLAFTIPLLCFSEMSDTGYTCDACKYAGSFRMDVTGTETRDGIYGEWIAVVCPECGETYMTYWRAAAGGAGPDSAEEPAAEPPSDPAPASPEAPAVPETPAEPGPAAPEDPAPAEPEAPAAPPSSPDTPGSGNGGQPAEPPVAVPAQTAAPSGPQPAETPVPVPQGNPDPAPAGAPSGQAPQEMTPEGGQDASAGNPGGSLPGRIRRNLRKYPYFSQAWPSRRLDMAGDPDILAPIPGIRVYPEPPAEGSSILQHMLDGE